ncbi:MAG: methionine adenosyltransferase [Victivallales bacterium]|nr:methionine adenosyltransferase [Victivallales bacterium]
MGKIAYTFTSESVSEGHPDKLCDQISDAVVDACLMGDPESHVACETLATTNYVVIAGEIATRAKVDYAQLARNVIKRIGYDKKGIGFSVDEATIDVRVHTQSPDINRGVTHATDNGAEQGAGDQGLMFGYACDETPALMPAPIFYAHRIVEKMAELRHNGKADFLRPDAKSQVSIAYSEEGKPLEVTDLVVAHQHDAGTLEKVRAFVREVVPQVIPANLLQDFDLKGENCHINSCGDFVTGGPDGDCGLTGRKIIVDTYGGMGRHGGGAFSGKDPSKVDRSASYMARYAAKNIVAAGLAKRCEIQVAYSIGVARPLNYFVNTFGTGIVEEAALREMLASGKIFDFRPRAISEQLNLKVPGKGWRYEQAASYGHFGRDGFPWEKTDKIAVLRAFFGK